MNIKGMNMELKVDGVTKTYKNGVKALENVSLTIPLGMYGAARPEWRRKIDTHADLATLQEPDAGSIHLGEIDVRGKDAA